jgi:hypothetical protein
MLCPAIQTLQRAAVCACRGTAEATTTETENETLNRISGNKTRDDSADPQTHCAQHLGPARLNARSCEGGMGEWVRGRRVGR